MIGWKKVDIKKQDILSRLVFPWIEIYQEGETLSMFKV